PPEAAAYPPPLPARPRRIGRSLALGCGCLLLLVAAGCAASVFALDAYAPDVLWCGPLEGLVERLGVSLTCPMPVAG
ncbi:MAG: hypothetical protein ACRDHL_08020, partial [Candidatus Promineifilaceae bacterium]